ncbi:uncharacterized protein LOC116971589 [Amblyraja radiata]|uniref:uncharacterized protein LOC116971589 n=1 Tax=Amblyraja radiata TaxID=386614 RepID=UPI0014023C8F|nr:uncharacterized protein LOC116971589 [Amblyraja radiata]
MQQQMESFECLRRQTLQNASLEKTEQECNISQLEQEQEQERRALQGQLEEMGEREKMYAEDFKALLSKHEGLQARNQALQAEREQLELERERARGEVEKMLEEREDLLAVIGAKEAVLRAERNKGAAEAVRANALRAENEELSRSLHRATEENASLKDELEKAKCQVHCVRAKNVVVRTKNLMLFQLVQELRGKESQSPGSSLQRGAARPGKCEALSTPAVLEKHWTASSLLECKAAQVDECWLLSARHTGIADWDVHAIQAEIEGEHSAYSPGLHSESHADEDPEHLNLPLASFNSITNPSAGCESLQTRRMPQCSSSPREQSNINEVRKGFEELEEEQRHNIGSQPHNPASWHSAAFRDRKIQGMARGSGDASQVLQEHNLPSLSIERYSFGSDGKCTPPLTGGRPDLEKQLNWSNKDLDGCTDVSQKGVDEKSPLFRDYVRARGVHGNRGLP